MSETSTSPSSQQPPDARSGRRIWGVAVAALAVGFVILVVSSARHAAVPVGASGGMSMPAASGDAMQMSLRDVNGRPVRIPDGRPGVALFVELRDCAACVTAVRTAGRAVGDASRGADLTVVSVDSATSRDNIAAFERTAGGTGARYVIDDRNGTLASMFKAAGYGTAVVYDARGKVVARASSASGIERGLRRAAG